MEKQQKRGVSGGKMRHLAESEAGVREASQGFPNP